MKAKKSLGQNFLMHPATAERIADAAHLTREDTVLEIGPGTGKLTRALLARAGKVIAIEADERLLEELQTTFNEELSDGRLSLVHGDARTFDPSSIDGPYALVANIPYYITGELLRKFLTTVHKPRSLTFLVQKEVAERIARSRKESLLSLAVKTYGAPRYCFTVPRGAFVPKPKVDSAVLSIQDIGNPFSTSAQEERFFDLVSAGFAHKRKLLANNLEALASKEQVHAAFAAAGIPEKARAEDLALAAWRRLVTEL